MVDLFPFLDNNKNNLEVNINEQKKFLKSNHDDLTEYALNRWFRPQLAIVGQEGLPDCAVAGNVLRPKTKLTLSLRLPPSIPSDYADKVLKELFEKDPPNNCKVTYTPRKSGDGFLGINYNL